LVFGEGRTDVKAHLVTDELTYLADWMDMSASEGLLHQPCVEALRKGCQKLRNYMRDDSSDTTRFQQPAAKFFCACRALDVAKLNILNVTHEFICENIPWFEDDIQAKTKLCTYLSSSGDLRATPHPADFWFAAAQQFPKLSVIALTCLSVPCNSIAAE